MIVIDYLQLMQGHKKTDNRQQEVSEISRSIKALAKEMEKIEQDTGHSFSVSQIRNIANYDERNSLLSQTNLVNAIRQQKPTIDKEHLTKFNNEIKEFILNEVHV